MENLTYIQNRISELLAVAYKVQDRQNTSVYISLEDFHNEKYYLYCSKEIWQRFLNLKTEGKGFIVLSKNEYSIIKQKQI